MKYNFFAIVILAICVNFYDATHIPKLALIRILENDLNNAVPLATKYINKLKAAVGAVSGGSFGDKLKQLPNIYSIIGEIYHCFTIGASQFTDNSNTVVNGRTGLEVPYPVINAIVKEYKNASENSVKISKLYKEMEQLIQVVISDWEQQGSNPDGTVVVGDNLGYGILLTLRKIQNYNQQITEAFNKGADHQNHQGSGFGIGGHAFINTIAAVGLKWGRLDHSIASSQIAEITRSFEYAQLSGSEEQINLLPFVDDSYGTFTKLSTDLTNFIVNIKTLQVLVPGIEII